MERDHQPLPGVIRAWDEDSDAQVELRFDRNFPDRTRAERDGELLDPTNLDDEFTPDQKAAVRYAYDLLSDPMPGANTQAVDEAMAALKKCFEFVDNTP